MLAQQTFVLEFLEYFCKKKKRLIEQFELNNEIKLVYFIMCIVQFNCTYNTNLKMHMMAACCNKIFA